MQNQFALCQAFNLIVYLRPTGTAFRFGCRVVYRPVPGPRSSRHNPLINRQRPPGAFFPRKPPGMGQSLRPQIRVKGGIR